DLIVAAVDTLTTAINPKYSYQVKSKYPSLPIDSRIGLGSLSQKSLNSSPPMIAESAPNMPVTRPPICVGTHVPAISRLAQQATIAEGPSNGSASPVSGKAVNAPAL